MDNVGRRDKKQRNKKRRESFITPFWRSTRPVMEYLVALTGGCPAAYKLIVHLLVSTMKKKVLSEDVVQLEAGYHVFIPIPAHTMKKLGGIEAIDWLRERKIIHRRYWRDEDGLLVYYTNGRCAEYALDPGVLLEVCRIALRVIKRDPKHIDYVDLVTRKPIGSRRGPKLAAFDFTGAEKGALVEIPWVVMLAKAEEMLQIAEATGRIDLQRRAFAAAFELQRIHAMPHFRRVKGGCAIFRSYYRRHPNGRRYQVGGGLQQMPRELKQVLLDEGKGYYNYDLSSAHVMAILKLAKAVNQARHLHMKKDRAWANVSFIDATPFEEIVTEGYASLADMAGLPEGIVKTIYHAHIMGADFEPRKRHAAYEDVRAYLGDWWKARKALKEMEWAFAAVTEARDGVIAALNMMIRNPKMTSTQWLRGFVEVSQVGPQIFIRNACGGVLEVQDIQCQRVAKDSSILSHLLTGIERKVISTLVLLLEDHGIDVISDEHDGLINRGSIPQDLIDKAVQPVLGKQAVLRLKPLCKPQDDPFRAIKEAFLGPAENEDPDEEDRAEPVGLLYGGGG